jgi:hypothetical protein
MRIHLAHEQIEQGLSLGLGEGGEQFARDGAHRRCQLRAQGLALRRQAEGLGPGVGGVGGAEDEAAGLQRRQGLAGRSGVHANGGGQPAAVPAGCRIQLRQQGHMPVRQAERGDGLALQRCRDLPEAAREILRHGAVQGGNGEGRHLGTGHMRRILRIRGRRSRRILRISPQGLCSPDAFSPAMSPARVSTDNAVLTRMNTEVPRTSAR